jgi:very-short-patch-repair endonuclease
VQSGAVLKRARKRRTPPPPKAACGVDVDMQRQRRTGGSGEALCSVDRELARLATSQDGIVERRQLAELGLGAGAIDYRVRGGRLILLYRGVYAVGHEALTDRGRMRAALIAAGPSAALSHWTAAAVWKLIHSMPPFVEVTVTRRGPRTRKGLVVHSTRQPPDVRIVDSLPVTAPLRTLADLAASPDIERMCAEALVLKLVTQEELDAARIIDADLIAPTRSRFERLFRATLRNAGLPSPITGYEIGPYKADFAWPAERVIVETDGWGAHGHRRAFEDDRARDAFLAANGWVVVRVTWRRLNQRPMLVMTQLAQTLAHRASTLHGSAEPRRVRR